VSRSPSEGLSESLEDYLEAVYVLVERDRVARMKGIAERVGVGTSSATGAIQQLADRGYVHYDPYQFITLTEAGEAAARKILGRHEVLKRFLTGILALPEAEAEAIGCKMEHAIDGEAFDRFVRFLGFLDEACDRNPAWQKALRAHCGKGGGKGKAAGKPGRQERVQK
jgi:DtxR family transcriptional regulator, Mn-dependent transcriptional regulator